MSAKGGSSSSKATVKANLAEVALADHAVVPAHAEIAAAAERLASSDRVALLSVGPVVWRFYRQHAEDKLLTLKLPLIGTIKTFHVKDLHFFFVALFGPDPGVSA